jgi:hypothetical protein
LKDKIAILGGRWVNTSVSPVVFEAYAGQYNWSGYKIDVTREGDHLFLQLAGQPRAEIFPSSDTEFSSRR